MSDTEYNGWKNYETWVVSMFLDGNYTGPNTPEACLEIVQNVIDTARGADRPLYKSEVADALKDFVEDSIHGDNAPSIGNDLLGHALGMVDWLTLAEHKIEEANSTTPTPERCEFAF